MNNETDTERDARQAAMASLLKEDPALVRRLVAADDGLALDKEIAQRRWAQRCAAARSVA